MSVHRNYRRQPVPGEMSMRHATITLPAPIRGLLEVENWAYSKPGMATILDNWFPTERGLKLRGGTERWCELPAPVEPVRSGLEYDSGSIHRIFAATSTRLFDVSFADNPVLQTGVGTITNGNFSASQFATAGGDWLLAVNDAGDYVRRYNGTIWEYLNSAFAGTPGKILMPDNTTAATGLTHIWKYKNRLFFVQGGTMNAYCLPLNAVAGKLELIPLSGAAKRGGSLLFGATWSLDAGDGLDDKCVFCTDLGELIVFSGSDPTTSANWRQEGRFDIAKPLGKNGHLQLGADLLIATIDGIVPVSQAVQKDKSALSLAAITFNIQPTWMREVRRKDAFPWTITKWDEGDMLLVNFPGGSLNKPDELTVGVSNLHTGAWSRFTNWDALCFMHMSGSLFFGTQTGKVMQVDSTGYDDARWDDVNDRFTGVSYLCRFVGGWETFQSPPNQATWFQARAAFFSSANEPFQPQLAATTDYEFRLPPEPDAGPDPGLLDVWDQGLWGPPLVPNWLNNHAYTVSTLAHDSNGYGYWTCAVAHTSAATGTFAEDRAANPTYWTQATYVQPPPSPEELAAYAQWDQLGAPIAPVRNTMWVSIGETGFSHAPIVQVTVSQQVKPDVELVSIAATFLRMGSNV
jgi:hypothetical protein